MISNNGNMDKGNFSHYEDSCGSYWDTKAERMLRIIAHQVAANVGSSLEWLITLFPIRSDTSIRILVTTITADFD